MTLKEKTPKLYNEANKSINKHISTILTAIVAGILPVLLYAGGAWVDSQIENKMGDYATKTEIIQIQNQISKTVIDRIREEIFTIHDRKIDGLGTPSDSKKLIRLENKIKNLKEGML